MQLNYKPSIEIAEEEAINTMFEENHYIDLRKRFDYDLTIGASTGSSTAVPLVSTTGSFSFSNINSFSSDIIYIYYTRY